MLLSNQTVPFKILSASGLRRELLKAKVYTSVSLLIRKALIVM